MISLRSQTAIRPVDWSMDVSNGQSISIEDPAAEIFGQDLIDHAFLDPVTGELNAIKVFISI